MATNAAAVAIAMMNGGGGGSGGDVTKQYVDDHLALKADKSETKEYPIAGSVSGDAVSVTDSANANVQGLTVYGRSRVSKNLFNGTFNELTPLHIPANTTFTASAKHGSSTVSFIPYYDSSTPINNYALNENVAGRDYKVITLQYECNFVKFVTNDNGEYQIELGSTPTPYEPYGIISIGDSGSLTITTASDSSESSTATLTTGLPLCGIPVNSGETYTDGDGVKWLADTANVEGVVKRTCKVTFDGSEDEEWAMPYDSMFLLTLSTLPAYRSGYITTLCNNYPAVPSTHDFSQLLSYNSAETITTNNRLVIIDKSFTSLTDFKTYLASNPVTVVYELATPTTQELTSAEKSALLNLKTYDSTTNLTITDDPFVDISYIKNTDNGKAAEQLADNLRASIGWISAIPEMHRNILRGKYLGSAVSAAQLAAVTDGSFDDLYVEDYWTIPVTIGGVTKNINWRIADIDYYLHTGDTPLTAHHLVIVPDTGLYAARMNATASNSGGYKASEMYTTNLGTAKTAINTAFPNMVLSHRDLIPENPGDNMSWADSTVELLSEIMVYGTQIMSPCNSSGQYNIFWTNAKSQLALFRLAPWFGVADDIYWLRDVVGQPSFAAVAAEGNADANGADNENGVRPYFLLGDAT